MTKAQALAALKQAGTAQNVKIYGRHGVTAPMYGVSFAAQKALQKSIGTDHALARDLWATGNHDARILATMIADPAALTSRDLDAWARDLDSYVLCDAFSGLVARTGKGLRKFEAWKNRKSEFVAAAAWNIISAVAAYEDGAGISDDFATEQIALVEAEIHQRPNRVRHSMNQALISLGIINPVLTKRAKAAAGRIGKVEVDHGRTSCQTPDAIAYIDKTLAYRAGQAARAKARKK